MWRSKDNFLDLVFSSHLYVGPGDRTQVARLVWQVPLSSESFCQLQNDFLSSKLVALVVILNHTSYQR